MSREVQAAVVLVMGVVIGRLALSDAHLNYVKSSLRWPLLLTAAALLVIGLLSVLRTREDELAEVTVRGPADDGDAPVTVGEHGHAVHDDAGGHGHDHGRAPRIGMLMLVPILALLLIAPAPLGSYAAGRAGANRVAEPVTALGELPDPVDGVVHLTVGETVVRALYEPDGQIAGTPVRLVGFVAHDDETAGYRLSRFAVACCAADATVRQVIVVGAGNEPPEDTWVEVVARFEGEVYEPGGDRGGSGVPIMRLVEQEEIEPPTTPYEY